MATFNDEYFYGASKDLGLRECPFNRNHKVKATKYLQHVMKCEQRYPTRDSLKHIEQTSNLLTETLMTSNEYLSEDKGQDDNNKIIESVVQELNQLTATLMTSTDVLPEDKVEDDNNNEVIESVDQEWDLLTENLMTSTEDLSEDKGEDHNNKVMERVHESDQLKATLMTSTEVLPEDKSKKENDKEVIESVAQELNQMIEISANISLNSNDCVKAETRVVDNVGSGDDNWTDGPKHFSLFPENSKPGDELSDEQIMEMTQNFADIAIIARMTKNQRKKLNEKLVEVGKLKNERKLKAFKELVMFKDECDPVLQSIPNEIRKPRIDAKQMFKLHKIKNNFASAKQVPSHENRTTTSSPTPVANSSENLVSDEKCFNVVCGGCKDSIDLNDTDIKRLTVFCAKCSDLKFGGYFECIPCKVYGYFANNQIEEHMSKHYPKDITHSISFRTLVEQKH